MTEKPETELLPTPRTNAASMSRVDIYVGQEHTRTFTDFVSSDFARELERELSALTARLAERERELANIGDILFIRCTDHINVPQQNSQEITGAECGGCIAAERDSLRTAVESREKERDEAQGELEEIRDELPDESPCKHEQTGMSLLDDIRDLIKSAEGNKKTVDAIFGELHRAEFHNGTVLDKVKAVIARAKTLEEEAKYQRMHEATLTDKNTALEKACGAMRDAGKDLLAEIYAHVPTDDCENPPVRKAIANLQATLSTTAPDYVLKAELDEAKKREAKLKERLLRLKAGCEQLVLSNNSFRKEADELDNKLASLRQQLEAEQNEKAELESSLEASRRTAAEASRAEGQVRQILSIADNERDAAQKRAGELEEALQEKAAATALQAHNESQIL